MTDEEFEHLQAALGEHGRTAAAISGDLEDGINADRLLSTAERDGLLAALAEAEADRDRARDAAVALEQENARLRDERERAYSALSEYGRNAVDISGDLEDGINAGHLLATAERGEDR